MEATTKNIDGYTVTYYPMKATDALTLDVKLMRTIAPVFKGIGTETGGGVENLLSKDVSVLADAVCEALSSLDDASLNDIVLKSMRGCTVCPPGAAPVQIASIDDVDNAFKGALFTLYKAMYESWRKNSLTPFSILRLIGRRTQTTSTSDSQPAATGGTGLKLER